MATKRSNLKAVRMAFKEVGVTLARAKRHEIWVCPKGHVVSVLPKTLSEGEARAYGNTCRNLRRVVREQGCEYAAATLQELGEREA